MQPDKYGPKTIESFEGLIQLQVRERVYDQSKWDDCAQEARILVWQILNERPESSRGYIARATSRRIQHVASGIRAQMGEEGRQGRVKDPMRRKPLSLDYMHRDPETPVHRPEDKAKRARVQSAVFHTLTVAEQQFIQERFYHGTAVNSIPGKMLWYRKGKNIQTKLREALKDLAA